MHSGVDYPVYTIFDAREMTQLPDHVLSRFPQLSAETPPNQSLAVVIAKKGLVERLVRIFARVYRGISFASSLEEAYTTIEAHKQDQQWASGPSHSLL